MRVTLVGFTCIVLAFALNSELSIFKMVESAYKITLAGAFVPLVVRRVLEARDDPGRALRATLRRLDSPGS